MSPRARGASGSPVLRGFARRDAGGVVALIRGVYDEYGMVFDPDFESDLGDVALHYGGHGGAFWVLAQGDRVVGSAGVRPLDASTAELKRLYLEAAHRGRGHGRTLVDRVLGWSRERGHRVVVAWSDVRLVTAHAVYRRLGFQPFGERTLDDPDRSHEIGFRLPLG
jgi:GNAT superfamily N-acetyltransferase